jgi:hypothetical protein
MQTSEQWPLFPMSREVLTSSIGSFLRTHRQGLMLLHEFMASEPADRTEAEFEVERLLAKQAHQAAVERVRASFIARRLAGLPLIDEALLKPTDE